MTKIVNTAMQHKKLTTKYSDKICQNNKSNTQKKILKMTKIVIFHFPFQKIDPAQLRDLASATVMNTWEEGPVTKIVTFDDNFCHI